jgi:branched-chain amino acid transport system ATP-binding protein
VTLIEIQSVSKNFGGLKAVDAFGLTIQEGEIVGLIGPNGAGKSTIFNLITGVYRIDSGEILFRGESIIHYKPDAICRKGIARTFQIIKPFGDMTVLDNVMVGAFCDLSSPNEARVRAMEILKFTQLDPKSHVLAKNLTIADKKCLELARALATRPRLLLLDEVMAGLNARETQDIIALVRRIRDRGTTLLIIEHVMRAVMALSDRIAILHHGRKIAEGIPEEVAKDDTVIKAYLGQEYVFAKNG